MQSAYLENSDAAASKPVAVFPERTHRKHLYALPSVTTVYAITPRRNHIRAGPPHTRNLSAKYRKASSPLSCPENFLHLRAQYPRSFFCRRVAENERERERQRRPIAAPKPIPRKITHDFEIRKFPKARPVFRESSSSRPLCVRESKRKREKEKRKMPPRERESRCMCIYI